jgi:dsRNA-specific ribonuclease
MASIKFITPIMLHRHAFSILHELLQRGKLQSLSYQCNGCKNYTWYATVTITCTAVAGDRSMQKDASGFSKGDAKRAAAEQLLQQLVACM